MSASLSFVADAWRRGRRLGAHDADRRRRRPRAAARAAGGAARPTRISASAASWWRSRWRRRKSRAPARSILVGDEPYYGPLGFKRIPRGQISMPRPVDLDRLLAVEFAPGAVAALTGEVCHADQVEGPASPGAPQLCAARLRAAIASVASAKITRGGSGHEPAGPNRDRHRRRLRTGRGDGARAGRRPAPRSPCFDIGIERAAEGRRARSAASPSAAT